MRRRIQSKKGFRFHASLVAFLYLFLCTAGALTHTHSSSEGEEGGAQVRASAMLHAATRSPAHCAYCDWQWNSVSLALAPQFSIGLETRRVELPVPALSRSQALPALDSSRAPPTA